MTTQNDTTLESNMRELVHRMNAQENRIRDLEGNAVSMFQHDALKRDIDELDACGTSFKDHNHLEDRVSTLEDKVSDQEDETKYELSSLDSRIIDQACETKDELRVLKDEIKALKGAMTN